MSDEGRRKRGPVSGPIQQPPVVFDAGFEPWTLAVGGALGATGHLSARCEPQEGFGDPEGLCVVVASLVEGGEPLVGMAGDELFGDARLVQADGLIEIPFCSDLSACMWRSMAASKPRSGSSSVPILSLSFGSRPKRFEGSPGGLVSPRPKMPRNRLRTNEKPSLRTRMSKYSRGCVL